MSVSKLGGAAVGILEKERERSDRTQFLKSSGVETEREDGQAKRLLKDLGIAWASAVVFRTVPREKHSHTA